jgi:hypothetical protein
MANNNQRDDSGSGAIAANNGIGSGARKTHKDTNNFLVTVEV